MDARQQELRAGRRQTKSWREREESMLIYFFPGCDVILSFGLPIRPLVCILDHGPSYAPACVRWLGAWAHLLICTGELCWAIGPGSCYFFNGVYHGEKMLVQLLLRGSSGSADPNANT